jgi:hypothetical protein
VAKPAADRVKPVGRVIQQQARADCAAAGRKFGIVSTINNGHYGDGVARRTKRLWMDEEKRSICFQTTAPGLSVDQVALLYAVNANLIFK